MVKLRSRILLVLSWFSVRVYQLFNPTSVEDKANKFVEDVAASVQCEGSKHKAQSHFAIGEALHKKFGREIGDFECRRQV